MAVAAGARALGLVSKMPSGPGAIDDTRIRQIAVQCPPGIATFLLTCKTKAEEIIGHIDACACDTVQLVDSVEEGAHEEIRRHLPHIKIVQVIHVINQCAIEEALCCADAVDAILLDSGNPGLTVKQLGGTGRTHNWEISRQIIEVMERPVYLAGGLTPENIGAAIDFVHPYGVDVCSGLRDQGCLNLDKLERFCAAALGA